MKRYLTQNKITSCPPTQKTVRDFILDAENKITKKATRRNNFHYPWRESNIRSDVQKVFTVKLIEEYIIKIKYISEITNKSQQKIVREIVNDGIDKILKSMDIQ